MHPSAQHKKILIAPLDWGLGHATRCVVLIRYFQSLNCNVTIAASGKIKTLLQTEFPQLSFLHLPGYNISYSKLKRLLPFKILIQIPKILKIIKAENKWLDDVLKKHEFDAVISDNRYGLHSKKVKCIFITHQLQIKTGFLWLDKKLQRTNYNYINYFSECWVPDFAASINIAGKLSHPQMLPAIPVKYIGALSRFSKTGNEKIKFKWMAIISGPEPQRTIFEKKIFEAASKTSEKFLIVLGLPGEPAKDFYLLNCKVFNHFNTEDMQAAIETSEFIISRCGYTTVMEIFSLQKKSVFIATPGQTEQEYLARHLLQEQWSYTFNQKDDFIKHLANAKSFEYKLPNFDMDMYKDVLAGFVNSL